MSTERNEVLLAELEIFEQAVWRSEETGEKRFNFFITLVTAVAAGIVALWSAEHLSDAVKDRLGEISSIACGALLIFGLVTFMRMRQRDRVTAQYKRSTWYIRDLFRTAIPDLKYFRLPRPMKLADVQNAGFQEEWRSGSETRWERFKKGGYSVSLGVLNGMLLAFMLMFAFTWEQCFVAVPFVAGLVFGSILCWRASEPYPTSEIQRPAWPPSS